MNKILRFATSFVLTFIAYLAVSLLLFGNENIGRTIFSALIFAVLHPIINYFIGKVKKGKEN